MAKYLWVGKGFNYPSTEVPTPAARLDKYCWNSPGNWKILIEGETGSWVDTTSIPGSCASTAFTDIAIIGNGAVNGLSASQYSGWIPAKCPLLFGGYSGGVGLGTWSHGSTTGMGGTFTNSLLAVYIDLGKGWSFNVQVGAGLTGFGQEWAIISDSQASPSYPTTSADYTTTVSAGFRNPEHGLRLKVADEIVFKDAVNSWYQRPLLFVGGIRSGGSGKKKLSGKEILERTRPTDSSENSYLDIPTLGGNSYSDRGLFFDGVKAYTQVSIPGITTAGEVKTTVNFQAGLGQDLKINGGSYKKITSNTEIVPSNDTAPFDSVTKPMPPEATTTQKTFFKNYDYGKININDVMAREIEYAKCDRVTISGGTAAKVDVHQFPYMVRILNYNFQALEAQERYLENSAENWTVNKDLVRYWDELPTYITCGFSGGQVWSDQLLGFTSTIPSTHTGVLNLTNKEISVKGYGSVELYDSPGDTYADVTSIEGRMFNDRHYCEYGEWSRASIMSLSAYNYLLYGLLKQRVFVGGKAVTGGDGTISAYSAYIPEININSTYTDVDEFGRFTEKWMPWQLQPIVYNTDYNAAAYGDTQLRIKTINNDGGLVVAPHSRYLPYKIGQIYMKNHGRFDFLAGNNGPIVYQRDTYSIINIDPHIYIGGITGASGDRLVGGVIMSDHTGTILLNKDHTLWNSYILPGTTTANNLRTAGISGAGTWTTFTPTLTST